MEQKNVVSYYYAGNKPRGVRRFLKIISWIAALAILGGFLYGSFFLYEVWALGKKINITKTENTSVLETAKSLLSNSALDLRGAEKGRINILLLGLAGPGKPGQNLTDTIMVASINTETNQVALLSIPRDLFVTVPDLNFKTKINSVYQYGITHYKDSEQAARLVSQTVTNITSENIDYYAVLTFSGFEKIIDSIGGINIMNERDIYDPRYPGPNYSYEIFELSKGFHQLDGATALKYARERHNDPEGDFGRAKRQQQILQATKNKVFSSNTWLNVVALNNLFNVLGETILTNIAPEEIGIFLELIKKLDTQNIANVVLTAWDKDSLLKVSHVFSGSVNAFVLVPRVGNYSEIQELSQNIFDLNAINRRKEEIAKEDAAVAVANLSGSPILVEKIKKLLGDNLNYKNIVALASENKIIQSESKVYDLAGGTKPWTLNELVTKLPAALSEDIPENIKTTAESKNADMVISLGKDLADIYNIEEGTIEDLDRDSEKQEQEEMVKN